MAVDSVVITDSANGICIKQLDEQFGPFRVVKTTLRGGPQDGVDIIDVICDSLRTRIIPTRGMGLAEAQFGADSNNRFGWTSPVRGPIHPSLVPVTCLLYTSPSPRDRTRSRMPSSA